MRLLARILCAAFLATVVRSSAAADGPDFVKAVAPIFTKYCTGCHNDEDREGKLSLASYESLLKGGAKGSVVTPGQPELSRLVRVLAGAAKPQMPPEGEEPPKPAEIELLKTWIAAGASGPAGSTSSTPMLVTPKIELRAAPKLAINAVALSPDGKLLAIARHGEVELQSLRDQKTFARLGEIGGSVNDVSFSGDGSLFVAAAGEPGLMGEARLFEVSADDVTPRAIFRGHKDSLYCARLSPDGMLLATAGYDNAIKLWNVADGTELKTLDGHNGAVFELAFRPDGKVLASASGDRTVKLWDVATGERLDTFKESLKELYALAFSPDGARLAAAGVDNRIRVWQITSDAKEGTNTLLASKFAHEMPILRLVWSADGQTLATSGEDRLVKIWNADTLTIRQTLDKQSDWASGLAISADGRKFIAGRVDGTLGVYDLPPAAGDRERPLTPLAEVPPEVDYGEQPAIDKLPEIAEQEPNDQPIEANSIATPGRAKGKIAGTPGSSDFDLYSFTAVKGEAWIIETNAARNKSPLDSKLEVLDAAGQSVPRLLLRAVRDSVIEFRGMTSEQRGVRLANWEEMLLNEYVYLTGDVIKLFQQRRGPDADGQFYPENGNRFAFFETTSRAHALGEPAYIVVPYAIGTELPNNGLPVFTLNYENDDESQRKLGKDSRLTFVAPANGTYLVRVSDVRGFAGDDFRYELTVRRPQPDFSVKLTGNNPTINAGSGKPFTVKAERSDNFNGPIRVEIANVPPGFHVTTPLIIQEGLYEADGVISALPAAAAPTDEQLKAITVTATATICGTERTKKVNNLGTIKLAAKPKVTVHLTLSAGSKLPRGEVGQTSFGGAPGPGVLPAESVFLRPGGRVACRLCVERGGFNDRIAFDVANLPHGVIVDDIGLSGVLIPEKQTERTIFLRAEPWVQAQTRTFFATAQVDGNQSSLPLVLRVEH